jgi:hypothetical protein
MIQITAGGNPNCDGLEDGDDILFEMRPNETSIWQVQVRKFLCHSLPKTVLSGPKFFESEMLLDLRRSDPNAMGF